MASDIPAFLVSSAVISTLVFLFSVWILIHYAIYSLNIQKNKLKYSLITILILLGWFGIVFFLGRTGFFAINPLLATNILLGFIVLFVILKKVYASSIIENITDKISVPWIIGIQTYRIVGYGFLIFYKMKLLPGIFAFSAGFGDILVGVTAPFVAVIYYLKKPYAKKLAIIWNIIGIADLVIAILIGIFAYPRPYQVLPVEVSTNIISLYPLVLIPLFAVPLAILLHFFSLRTIRKMK